ncbi:hypothetical protein NN3_16260 [Nocardia neocaledoniensis NBRC 108232]|nr:hypothetical protein NN3_16260 [Nocardia neocaledoniensis NBRC 108232]
MVARPKSQAGVRTLTVPEAIRRDVLAYFLKQFQRLSGTCVARGALRERSGQIDRNDKSPG